VRASALIQRLPARGASVQVAVAGAYAWAVTVAPAAWAPGAKTSSSLAKIAAGAALVALVAGAAGESRWGARARFGSLWAFVLLSALAWCAAPTELGPGTIDALGGLAGMLGWGLFALASAGPALGARRESERVVDDLPLEARKRLARGDSAYILGSVLVAVALQVVGWREASPERALLVRLVALASGLAAVGAAAEMASARHAPRVSRPWKVRVRGAAGALTLLGMLALGGLLLALTR
jgi:hypothetical protein